MKISTEQKGQIRAAMAEDLKRRQADDKSYSQTAHSNYLKINTSVYSRVVQNGELERVLSDTEWLRIAKKLHVDITGTGWKTVKTAVFEFVTGQMEACQTGKLSAINADEVGIGKTHAAEYYARTHNNVIYIKCNEGMTRANLIRLMAQEMGLDSRGKVDTIRENVEMHLLGLNNPLIVLDDAGYMNDRSWMQIKGLYDATEHACGWYLIGDTSLQKAIQKFVYNDKLGWKALFDRFNQRFNAISNLYVSEAEVQMMRREMVREVLRANYPDASKADEKEIMTKANLSLRVLRKEITNRLRNANLFNTAA